MAENARKSEEMEEPVPQGRSRLQGEAGSVCLQRLERKQKGAKRQRQAGDGERKAFPSEHFCHPLKIRVR